MALRSDLATVQDAISIAVKVARDLGVPVQEPVPLRSTNNAVAWLSPTNIVAKVSVECNSRLQTELQVAQELSALGAPIVSLAPGLPAIVHRRDGFEVTFWTYHAQPPIEPSSDSVAHALNRLHVSLGQLSPALKASLPSYLEELGFVRSLLADKAALPALAKVDRELLILVFDQLKVEFDRLVPASRWVVIHGSPHPYNVLVVGGKPAFIDFETTCFGPLEWDLAHLDAEAYPQVDSSAEAEVLSLCRRMAIVKTAILCTAEIDRGDMREHADYHLTRIREDFAERNEKQEGRSS